MKRNPSGTEIERKRNRKSETLSQKYQSKRKKNHYLRSEEFIFRKFPFELRYVLRIVIPKFSIHLRSVRGIRQLTRIGQRLRRSEE